MRGDYDRLRELLSAPEQTRLRGVDLEIQRLDQALDRVPDRLAADIRDAPDSRLARSLADLMVDSFEQAVARRPQAVIGAVYPVIGAAIRRSLAETFQQLADDLDGTMRSAFSLRALRWRWDAWRLGVPYAQVALRHTTRYQVEHLFLICPDSGLLLGHVTADDLPELDADAVAGMFAAINQFVRESVAVGGARPGIGHAQVGDYRLVVSHGPTAWMVAFVRGVPTGDFGARLDEVNEALHAQHGRALADVDRPVRTLEPDHLARLNGAAARVGPAAGRRRWAAWLLIGVVFAALAAYVATGVRWSMRAEAMREALASVPGLQVVAFDRRARNAVDVRGLLDPDAPDPRRLVTRTFPDVEARWVLSPYLSLDPDVVRRRAARMLALPLEVVGTPDAEGRLPLRGDITFATRHRLQTAAPPPGVTALDLSGTRYPRQDDIEAGIAGVEALGIGFDSGTVVPATGMEDRLEQLVSRLQELQAIATPQRIGFRMEAVGYTDELGGYALNRHLRERRAEWLATEVMADLHAPSVVVVDRQRLGTLPYRGRSRSAALLISPFPVEP
ncbi:hypothetical protein [Luteimonas abyssi]|uniref:hypothetical protein n=1 Tax=Luteimonas abyssi TaxID=1247514 RepID=UPI000737B38A|nr:hypothetical protein [Luteimonas abyssi]